MEESSQGAVRRKTLDQGLWLAERSFGNIRPGARGTNCVQD
ncbi:MAG: hypothetical protein NTX52_11880 [Planctomycetota bacterium]|nr:hypothetical protein [Planctomycetota bacterium]